jgi:hypothetical protein
MNPPASAEHRFILGELPKLGREVEAITVSPREMQYARLRGNHAASSMTYLCCQAKLGTAFMEAELVHLEEL